MNFFKYKFLEPVGVRLKTNENTESTQNNLQTMVRMYYV